MNIKFIILLTITLTLLICFISIAANNKSQVQATVVEADNSNVISRLKSIGYQTLVIEINSGIYKGQITTIKNKLSANNGVNKLYAAKDSILVSISLIKNKLYGSRVIPNRVILRLLFLVTILSGYLLCSKSLLTASFFNYLKDYYKLIPYDSLISIEETDFY